MEDFNAENEAVALREAMKGGGTDEDTIIRITGNCTVDQRQEIREAYKSAFGRCLLEDVDDELSSDFKKVVHSMFLSPIEFDVEHIRKAVEGGGTDEDVLTEVIGSRSNYRLTQIKEMYQEKFGETLESRIKEECSKDYRNLVISLLQCNRSEETDVDDDAVETDANALYKAGEGKWGTDEDTFNRIFALRSPTHLQAVNKLYTEKHGNDLMNAVEDEFSGDIKVLLKTVIHSHIAPADYFKVRVRKACEGWGTDDSQLIRALVTCDEILLGPLKALYLESYGKTLRDEIESETSGYYQKILLELIKAD